MFTMISKQLPLHIAKEYIPLSHYQVNVRQK